jgi:anti-sigma regulatory factor (Ser/Thr protein kinase)
MSVERLELRLTNRLEEKERLQSTVEQFGLKHRWPRLVLNEIELVLEELITNIISYAFEDRSEHEINFLMEVHADRLEIQTEDNGKAFDPLSQPAPDLTKPLEERPIGGLGIYMIRKLTDEAEYRREGRQNFFRFKKSLLEPKFGGQ